MPETEEKIKYVPVKEIYRKETSNHTPEELQKNEDIIFKNIKAAQEEVRKMGQIKKLICFSSDSDEHLSLEGDYVAKKELVIDEVFRVLGQEPEKGTTSNKTERICFTVCPTEKKDIFTLLVSDTLMDKERYIKGIIVAPSGQTKEDIIKKLLEIKKFKEE
jgi:hypothetical protein